MKTALMAVITLFIAPVAPAQTVLEPSNIADQDNLQISNIVFSNDGSRAFASNENCVFVWETGSGSLLKTITIPAFEGKLEGVLNHVQSFSVSPGGTKLCTTHYSYRALIWDIDSGAVLTTIDDGTTVSSYSYSHSQFLKDEKSILISSPYRTFRLFSTHTGEMIHDYGNQAGGATDFELIEDRSIILKNQSGSIVRMYSFPNFEPLFNESGYGKINLFTNEIYVLRGESVINNVLNMKYYVYSLDNMMLLYDSNIFQKFISQPLDISPDGKFVVRGKTADSPEPTRLADLDTTLPVRTLNGEAARYDQAFDVEFAPNGRSVAVSYGDRILLYDISDLTASVKDPGLHGNE